MNLADNIFKKLETVYTYDIEFLTIPKIVTAQGDYCGILYSQQLNKSSQLLINFN